MGRIFGRFLLLLAVVVVSAHNDDGLFELNIIHYNDFHARFDEVHPAGGVCGPRDDCIGGFARLYTAINQLREAEPDSLLFNGGDSFQGSMWYNFLRWNVTQHFMNMLPHDAHVLGNHDFTSGIDGLIPYLQHLNSPMLGANVNTTFERELGQYVKNHIIIERRGRKIGVIGVLLREFAGNIGQVIMEDELEAVRRETAILTELGVDIIIVLSHVGYTSDMYIAARAPPEVDIIVGAHSHTLLFTGETPDGSNPAGPYPTVVTQNNGHKVLVVQAWCWTRYLGDIKLYFNDDGIIEKWKGTPIYLGTSIVKDPGVLRELEPWRQQLAAVGSEVLAHSRVRLSRSSCTRRECLLGSWACDGFLEQLIPRANGSRWNDGQVCLINNGGIRDHINAGDITTEALLMAFPFENTVQLFDLKGRYLLEALEFSVDTTDSSSQNFHSRRMLQIGGMRNVYNASAPVGSRVTATVRCIDCEVPRYVPLDPDGTYRVVTQSFLGDGGSGFTMVSKNRKNLVNLDLDYVILQQYTRRQGSIVHDIDGRIQIVH